MKKRRPLGQNFLSDPQVAERILDEANLDSAGRVLEIGPGEGQLTAGLLDRADSVVAIELDPKLCAVMQKKFGNNPRFTLIQADALKYDYSALGSEMQVVSNLPYYVATPILKRLTSFRSRFRNMTLMLQKEVAERVAASPDSKSYGSLSVFLQLHCDLEKLFDVGKASFSPPPKVDSTIIRVVPLPAPRVEITDEKLFFRLVHAAFFHKRKMLKNNLSMWKNLFQIEHDKMNIAGIDLSRRGESLSLQEFAVIANHIQAGHGSS